MWALDALQKGAAVDDKLISVIDLAAQLDRRKQTLFKVIYRLGIETVRQPNGSSRGATLAYVTHADAVRIQDALSSPGSGEDDSIEDGDESYAPTQKGVFYLLVLEPKHDPGRFKVGFATNLSERLRTHRCSAPFATVVKSWPCKSLWEKTAIECVSVGCERLHTEVFRTTSIEAVLAKCEQFFDLMPSLSGKAADTRQE